MLHIAEHPADEADVGEFRQAFRAAVAFVEDVEGLDVEAELHTRIDAFGDWWIKTVEAIEQENLVFLQCDRAEVVRRLP